MIEALKVQNHTRAPAADTRARAYGRSGASRGQFAATGRGSRGRYAERGGRGGRFARGGRMFPRDATRRPYQNNYAQHEPQQHGAQVRFIEVWLAIV